MLPGFLLLRLSHIFQANEDITLSAPYLKVQTRQVLILSIPISAMFGDRTINPYSSLFHLKRCVSDVPETQNLNPFPK